MENHTYMKANDKIIKEQVLALDIATHTGYYSIHSCGTWNFTESKKRNDNKQHKDFRDTLISYLKQYSIQQVVAEDINVNNHFCDMRKLSEFRGILFEVCDELDLPEPIFVNVTALKKWATDNGRADKKQMMEACKDRFHFQPLDDNVADACLIFHYYLRKYRID